jgi:hypothetical protein
MSSATSAPPRTGDRLTIKLAHSEAVDGILLCLGEWGIALCVIREYHRDEGWRTLTAPSEVTCADWGEQ